LEYQNSYIICGAKRSGTTLLNRIFDSHPELMVFVDEAFFWEHVNRYDRDNQIDLFIDIFSSFGKELIFDSILDRALLPWVGGVFTQRASAVEISKKLEFDSKLFKDRLKILKESKNIQDIWTILGDSYSKASGYNSKNIKGTLIKSADYGQTILAAKKYLTQVKSVFILRNPFYAIDSLKKSRQMRKEKILHPINFAEVISDYLFFWNKRHEICEKGTLLILYEELVTNPVELCKKMSEHFGISFDQTLMNPSLAGEVWKGHSSFQYTNGIDQSVLERKIELLSANEIKLIEKHLSPILRKYDYSVDTQLPGRLS
jgi:hypothetical protein